MSRIHKFGNKSTEGRMIELFRLHGIKGWRRHLHLPGRPDFTFRRERVVVFTDGCYWHRCPACNWTPTSNVDYWVRKLAKNVQKDREADEQLRIKGWQVVRVWEHDIKQKPELAMSRIRLALAGQHA